MKDLTPQVKKKTPARKIMDAYCKQNGLSSESVRFMFDGTGVSGWQSSWNSNL